MRAVHSTGKRCDHCEAMIEHEGEPRGQRTRRLLREREVDRLHSRHRRRAVARSFYRTIVPYRPRDF